MICRQCGACAAMRVPKTRDLLLLILQIDRLRGTYLSCLLALETARVSKLTVVTGWTNERGSGSRVLQLLPNISRPSSPSTPRTYHYLEYWSLKSILFSMLEHLRVYYLGTWRARDGLSCAPKLWMHVPFRCYPELPKDLN